MIAAASKQPKLAPNVEEEAEQDDVGGDHQQVSGYEEGADSEMYYDDEQVIARDE